MRGGHINQDKVYSYKSILYVLCKLSVIDAATYNDLERRSSYINPLVRSNRIFIEHFNKIKLK